MRPVLWVLTTLAISAQPNYQYFLNGNAADVQTKPTPGYLLAGGGKDVDPAFKWFLTRANGGDALVLRASGGDAYNPYFHTLAKLDSVETIIFKNESAAREPFIAEKIRNAEAIFLAGGDQWNYIRYWRNTPIAEALNDAIRRGVPIGGTSAGLAVLGEFAFSAKHDTVTTPEALANPYDEKVDIYQGLLNIPQLTCLITDSHFAKRDRMGRLLVFLARIKKESNCPTVRGLGVDERAAVTLDPTGHAQVMGEGAAYLVQLSTTPNIQPNTPATIPAMQVTAIPTGQSFQMNKWPAKAYELSVTNGGVKSTKAGQYATP